MLESEVVDTSPLLRARLGADFDAHFAADRPEDVEVAEDGSVYLAMTNNSTVKDSNGAVRVSASRATTPPRPRSRGRTSPRAARRAGAAAGSRAPTT